MVMSGSFWLALRDLIKPIVGVGLLKVSALLFTTIASIIVARHLGPAAYGQVTFVLAVLSLLSIPSNNAMAPLLVREISVNEQGQNFGLIRGLLNWSRTVTLVSVLLALFALSVWAFFAFNQAGNNDAKLFLISAPLLVVWALMGRISNILIGLKKTVLAQCFDWFVSPALYFLCICTLWYLHSLTPATVLGSSVSSLALAMVAGYLVLQKNLPASLSSIDSETAQQAWLASWRYFIFISLVTVANMRVPVLFMGFLSEGKEIGLYRVAENITSLVAVALLIVNMVIGPYISRLYASGELEKLGAIARGTARIALSITLPTALIVGLYNSWIIEVVFGAEYSGASVPLTLLLISQVFNVACGSVGLILNMTGLEKRALVFWLATLVINTLGCVLLIPAYGATGAAASVLASTVLWNFLLLIFIRKLLGINVSVV